MTRRPVIIALFVMLLMFCKAKTESVTSSTQSAATTQSTATTAPPPATTTTAAATATTAASPAPAAGVIATQDTNYPGLTAEVTEFRRKGNTLTAKVRLTNKSDKNVSPEIRYNAVYLIDTAGGKKYQTLKDETGTYIAALSSGSSEHFWEDVKAGESKTIWMKFPAPPPEVKTITLQLPNMPPFDDLTIQD